MSDFCDDVGNVSIDEANEMNVPVNIWILEAEDEPGVWELSAANYMPRKNMIQSEVYLVKSNKKETLEALVQKHIVPLYEIALSKLKTESSLYYWEKP